VSSRRSRSEAILLLNGGDIISILISLDFQNLSCRNT